MWGGSRCMAGRLGRQTDSQEGRTHPGAAVSRAGASREPPLLQRASPGSRAGTALIPARGPCSSLPAQEGLAFIRKGVFQFLEIGAL